MIDICYLDLESYSEIGIDHGNHKYARHPSTDFNCLAWSINKEPIQLWLPGDPLPKDLVHHIERGRELWAHHAINERTMLRYVGHRRYGFPQPTIEQMVCTLVMCGNLALPLSLENAAIALCLPVRKDMIKRKSMLLFAKPLGLDPITNEPLRATRESHPKEFREMCEYCIGDVEVEIAIAEQVKRLTPRDAKYYIMDQEINDRGVKVDIPTVKILNRLAKKEQDRLNGELQGICGLNYTQVAKLGRWVASHGITVPSLDKHDLSNLLKLKDLPANVRRALLIRQEVGKSSVSKLDAMLMRCEEDDRARGLFQFKGAVSTGRYAHRAIQSGNMPRPVLPAGMIDEIIDWLSTFEDGENDEYVLDVIHTIWGRPTHVFSDCLRGMLIADEGKVLIAPDFVSIESLVAAWLVGDDAKVKFMGDGGDVYRVVARFILELAPFRGWIEQHDIPVTKKQRQDSGKIPELSCGYQGGHKETGAVGKFCVQNNVPYPGERVAKRWVDTWREYHPFHVKYWDEIDEAATQAVLNPGEKFSIGPVGRRVTFRVDGNFLLCRCPSESQIAYPFPRVENKKFGRGVTYMKSKDKQWFRNSYYGGHGLENATQHEAMELLQHGMWNLREAGFPVVTHSHDEAPVETDRHDAEAEVCRIFAERPAWAADLPYRSSAFTKKRYRKE